MVRGMKAIDAHCHIYPEKIAEKATAGTDAFYNTKAVFNGTVSYLLEDGAKAGIDHFLVQSVATAPKQVSSINRFIARSVQESGGKMTGLGTLHPYSEHLEEDVEELIGLGLIGVKLHPDIQQIPVDDPHCMEIYELCRGRLPILMHTGDKRYDYSNPNRLVPVLQAFPDLTVIGAHLGGYSIWDEAYARLKGRENLYFDCSSSVSLMEPEMARKLIRGYGPERVMFGSDYPMWSPSREMETFLSIGLTDREYEQILSRTAVSLFHLQEI